MKIPKADAPAVSESRLRLPSGLVAAGLLLIFGVSFYFWWRSYPMAPELFADYFVRDRAYLLPDWDGFIRVWSFNLGAILLLTLTLAAFWGMGRNALAWAFPAAGRGLLGFLFALALGKGLLGTLILGLGLAGLLSKPLFWIVLAAACWMATGFRALRAAAGGVDWRGMAVENKTIALAGLRSLSPVDWALLGSILIVLGGNFFPALQPEWFYDSLVYHMAVPEQYLIEHKIFRVGHTFFSNFPFLQEMQYMFLLGLGNGVSGKLLHWTDGLLGALAVYALARRFLSRTGALLAQAAFLSQPTLRFLQHVTMVELGVSFYGILAAAALAGGFGWMGGRERSWRRWLFLCAWLLGFSQGTKYLAIFSSGILLVSWLGVPSAWAPVMRGISRWSGILIVIGWASVWTLPWLGKNWLFTGNPVFPMANGVFRTLNWDEDLYRNWMHDNQKYGTASRGESPLKWLAMPLMASIDTPHFGTFTINLFPLLFLPLLFLYRGPPPVMRFLAIYAGLYSVLWAVTSQQTRFLFPMVAQASVPAAFVVMHLGGGSRILRGILYAGAAWILLVCSWGQVHNRYTNHVLFPFLFGHMDHEGILRFGVSYYDSIRKANESVPAGSRILFLGGDESYYAKCRRICSSIYDRPAAGRLARKARSAEDLRRLFKRNRITHLLVHNPRAEEYAPRGMFQWGKQAQERFLEVWRDYGRLVCLTNDVLVFELGREKLPESERKRGVPAYFYPLETIARAHKMIDYADRCFKREMHREAFQVSQDMVALMPDVSYVYAYRAYARTFLKQEKEAIADYEKAIALDYPTPMVYYNLGLLLQKQEKLERALELFSYAIKTAPGMNQAREQAFETAVRIGRYRRALEIGEEALALGLPEAEWLDNVVRLRDVVRRLP